MTSLMEIGISSFILLLTGMAISALFSNVQHLSSQRILAHTPQFLATQDDTCVPRFHIGEESVFECDKTLRVFIARP